ncbi:reverse transcriptase domain-containing protein [Tanacetum coccineum]
MTYPPVGYDVSTFPLRTTKSFDERMAKPIMDEARAEHNFAEPSIESNVKYELGEELLKELLSNSYSGRVEEDVAGHIAKILEILDPIELASMDPFQLRMMTFPLSLSGKARKCNDDKDQTNSSMLTKPEIKIGDEFLKILHDNSFNGTDGCGVIDHIARVLKITEWIKIPNTDKDELRLHVFSKSLSGDAEKWWNIEGTTTTWKELCDKLFHKYYPLSHTYKSKIRDDLNHVTDYIEFLYWLASKFDNYWELDKNVKSGLLEFYVNGRTKGTIDDLVNYNEPCDESNKKTRSDLFLKPYLDAQDGKDIYKIIDRDYSPIPIPTHHELCQTEEFTVVWYSIGSCEEFITVGPSKISTVEKPSAAGNFVLHIVLTKSGIVPVSAARPINTVAPKSFVNAAKTRPNAFQKKQSDKYYWGNKGLMLLSPQHAGFGDLKLRQTQVSLELKVLVVHHTTNGHQFTMSNRQERIGYSRANGNWRALIPSPRLRFTRSTKPLVCREYPCRIFNLCSVIDRGTPVMCFGSHANISRFLCKSAHTAALPVSDSDPTDELLLASGLERAAGGGVVDGRRSLGKQCSLQYVLQMFLHQVRIGGWYWEVCSFVAKLSPFGVNVSGVGIVRSLAPDPPGPLVAVVAVLILWFIGLDCHPDSFLSLLFGFAVYVGASVDSTLPLRFSPWHKLDRFLLLLYCPRKYSEDELFPILQAAVWADTSSEESDLGGEVFLSGDAKGGERLGLRLCCGHRDLPKLFPRSRCDVIVFLCSGQRGGGFPIAVGRNQIMWPHWRIWRIGASRGLLRDLSRGLVALLLRLRSPLVDGNKKIITESTMRRDLQLEDAEGVDCLPNATIFEQLALMGTTAWNEFSSTMASAIICLATNQKFNFLKYIFESMVKNLENVSGKFLMYPRVLGFLIGEFDDSTLASLNSIIHSNNGMVVSMLKDDNTLYQDMFRAMSEEAYKFKPTLKTRNPKNMLKKILDACKSKSTCEGGDDIESVNQDGVKTVKKGHRGCGSLQPTITNDGMKMVAGYKLLKNKNYDLQ